MAGCGGTRLSVAEFCDLAAQVNAETARLVQLEPGTAEFDRQRDKIRQLNDDMFSSAPDEIAEVTDELRPMLTAADADNDRVNQLLDRVAVFVDNNCEPTSG